MKLIAADGVALHARLWQPDGRGPWPVLLMRQPYGSRIASTVTYAHPRWYVAQGYAVVVQDVRGRGDSGGAFAGFRQEPADTASTIAWLRSQSWCNGRVGTYGFSYQGLSQLLNTSGEHLPDALVPAMAGVDERLHWASEGGCHWWALSLAWGLQLAAQRCRRAHDQVGWQAIRASLASGAFVTEGLDLMRRWDPDGMVLGWLDRDPADPVGWLVHEPPQALWQKPLLLIGGWHDPHLRGVLDLWRRAVAAGGHPLLRIGAWSHLNWQGGIDRLQLAFFDRHLRMREPPEALLSPQPSWLQDLEQGLWLPRLPGQGSGQSWGLRSGGLAAVDPLEGELSSTAAGGTVTLVHDPWRPLPGRGGHLGLDAGAVDRADLDQRCDVACFTSAPLQAPLELLGQPQVGLIAQADQPGFDLCAALSLLRPDGQVSQLSTGVARHRGAACEAPQQRCIELQPLFAQLRRGDRLRLSIALAAWPQIAVNPGDGTLPRGAVNTGHREITVELGLDQASLSIQPMVGAN
ncbi:MAG: CocE/NonD family hydrolase [Cyanobacteria bacterium REEB417]|nr:CocE/NonD family hydrolase [Cyanobacteria bacterium REEB417]